MKNLLTKYAPPPNVDAAIKIAASTRLITQRRRQRLRYSFSALAAAACLILGMALLFDAKNHDANLSSDELLAIWETDQMEVDVLNLVCDIENGNTTLAGMQ